MSLSNVYASSCQYEAGVVFGEVVVGCPNVRPSRVKALKYVSFAVQMLGKSFKMMPVMTLALHMSSLKPVGIPSPCFGLHGEDLGHDHLWKVLQFLAARWATAHTSCQKQFG